MYIDRNSNKIFWYDLKKYAQYTNLGPAKFVFQMYEVFISFESYLLLLYSFYCLLLIHFGSAPMAWSLKCDTSHSILFMQLVVYVIILLSF